MGPAPASCVLVATWSAGGAVVQGGRCRARQAGLLAECLVDGLEEGPYADRFGEVGVGAGGEELSDVMLGGVGAENDHGDASGGRVGPQAAQDFPAGHVGQVEVKEDKVGVVL